MDQRLNKQNVIQNDQLYIATKSHDLTTESAFLLEFSHFFTLIHVYLPYKQQIKVEAKLKLMKTPK